MRIVLLAASTAVALIASVVVLGVFVPKTHIATRTVVIDAPPPAVWKAITTVEAYPQWRDVQTATLPPSQGGRKMWKETDRHGDTMTMEVMEEIPERRLVTRIADKKLPFGGTWTYELSRQGAELS